MIEIEDEWDEGYWTGRQTSQEEFEHRIHNLETEIRRLDACIRVLSDAEE